MEADASPAGEFRISLAASLIFLLMSLAGKARLLFSMEGITAPKNAGLFQIAYFLIREDIISALGLFAVSYALVCMVRPAKKVLFGMLAIASMGYSLILIAQAQFFESFGSFLTLSYVSYMPVLSPIT